MGLEEIRRRAFGWTLNHLLPGTCREVGRAPEGGGGLRKGEQGSGRASRAPEGRPGLREGEQGFGRASKAPEGQVGLRKGKQGSTRLRKAATGRGRL